MNQKYHTEPKNDQGVPLRFACPVCGKWGRRHKTIDGVKYYYCNPRARKGGKGCGEYFARIGSACEMAVVEWEYMCRVFELTGDIKSPTYQDRVIELGYEGIMRMKKAGVHDPYSRKTKSREFYNLFEKIDGNCRCGCGLPVPPHKKFYEKSHGTALYAASEMVTNQGERLRRLLENLRGKYCEMCGSGPKDFRVLEVDHIIEVKEGGGMCWIDNFQLLCQKCHKNKTAAYAKMRAKRRRDEKELRNNQIVLFKNKTQ